MRNEESWNTFTRTGRVEDYLSYRGSERSGYAAGQNGYGSRKGGERERASDGHGAVGSYHW